MTGKVTEFITEIAAHYPTRKADDATQEAWMESMVRELSGYPAEVLRNAARHMVRTRKDSYRTFPTLSECIAACDDSAEWLRRKEAPLLDQTDTAPSLDWTAERLKLATDLVRSAMGKEALKGDWHVALWNFCRQHKRLPVGHEIEQCKRNAEAFRTAYEEVVRTDYDQLGSKERADRKAINIVLLKLGNSMLERRKELADKISGRTA